MNDEELVEVIARWMHLYDGGEGDDAWRALVEVDQDAYREDAHSLLAALRSAGFQVFRPEDAVAAWVGETNVDEVEDLVPDRYAHAIDVSKMDPVWVIERLVPADSGGSG